jgi:hypothetical protein
MALTLAVAILASILVALTIITGAYYVGKRKLRQLFRDIFEAPDETSPSAAAVFVKMAADVFAQQFTNSLKATFMGVESVAARNEKKESALAALATNPTLLAIASSFPAVRKMVEKNPAIAAIANQFMSKKNGSKKPEEIPLAFKL